MARRLLPASVQAQLATKFSALHNASSNTNGTLLLLNVTEPSHVKVALEQNGQAGAQRTIQAFATASYGVALTANTTDDDLTWKDNRRLSTEIGKAVFASTKADPIPFSVDIQEGYGDELESVIESVIVDAGAVGVNLEDAIRATASEPSKLMETSEAVERIKRTKAKAKELGVPDFVINARTDALIVGSTVDEAIKRGKLYLEAGATVVFVWGGSQRGVSTDEVKRLAKELDGRLNLSLKPGGLTLGELSDIGIARASLGPQLLFKQREGGEKLVASSVQNLLKLGKINS
ncbi:Phosphoenolpyruvate/pyruvate domain-containing protein [Acaromyces ingoldii]|uniref:Phosphoenolpyruvate/pyruvate domain-containing protein n=1 Tax=Acaromyces ingoldii TaxID=215250 RepID=A0A316YAF5_9BASI|nr:Phosphoenolpyruvate/pyruvate domain-containing protein [Acaromyces ingoldii]PWN86820.1 Phosphoenolpyruvate/pyruvate domain-containing protein [Acaromyces ingoldii]